MEKLFVMGFAYFLMLVGVDGVYFKQRETLGVSVGNTRLSEMSPYICICTSQIALITSFSA